jgi:hypothetical protein
MSVDGMAISRFERAIGYAEEERAVEGARAGLARA